MILIDKLIGSRTCIIPNLWATARPVRPRLRVRVVDAFRVLTGRAQAVQFAQDLLDRKRSPRQIARIMAGEETE